MRRPDSRLTVEPLAAVLGTDSATLLARRIGVSDRQVRRAKTEGLTVDTADRWAIAAGHHPGLVWPDWWDLSTGGADA